MCGDGLNGFLTIEITILKCILTKRKKEMMLYVYEHIHFMSFLCAFLCFVYLITGNFFRQITFDWSIYLNIDVSNYHFNCLNFYLKKKYLWTKCIYSLVGFCWVENHNENSKDDRPYANLFAGINRQNWM